MARRIDLFTGLVGIISNDAARFSLFPACVVKLAEHLPIGAKIEWVVGGDWCGARNTLARMALDQGADWLWFMDDDHAFAPGMLEQLLAHRVPLVTPVCLTRVAPFMPVQYTEKLPDREHGYLPIPLVQYPDGGLVKLEAGGCAGMLIRREVLEAIEPPWFEYTDRSEDIIFCEKAKAAGFEIYCDLDARLGHITTAVVEAAVDDGEWRIGLTVGTNLRLIVPFEAQETTIDDGELGSGGTVYTNEQAAARLIVDVSEVEAMIVRGDLVSIGEYVTTDSVERLAVRRALS